MAKSKVKTSGIDHVVLHVTDLARSKAFYMQVLGMTEHHGGDDWAFMRCGDQIVGLFEIDEGEEVALGYELNHMALNVASGSNTEIKAHLKANGVKVSGRRGDPDCIYFDDPDGHRLQIMPADRG